MQGVLNQIINALGIGLHHHTDYELTMSGNLTIRFRIGPPSDFYGYAIYQITYGNILDNAFTIATSQLGYEYGVKRIHQGYIADGASPWLWIEPGKEVSCALTNNLAIASYFQMTIWELYFRRKQDMDLAKLAFWEFMSPSAYNIGVEKGYIAPVLGVMRLPA